MTNDDKSNSAHFYLIILATKKTNKHTINASLLLIRLVGWTERRTVGYKNV